MWLFPPLAGTTASCAWRGSSKTAGAWKCAGIAPAGDHAGNAHWPSEPVTLRGSPPPAETTYRSEAIFVSQSSSRAETNAIHWPSGDQVGDELSKSPSVSWTGSLDPSDET